MSYDINKENHFLNNIYVGDLKDAKLKKDKGIDNKQQAFSYMEDRYPVIRTLLIIYKLCAWIIFFSSLILTINEKSIYYLAGGFILFLILYILAENIQVILDIERNTRKIAEILTFNKSNSEHK